MKNKDFDSIVKERFKFLELKYDFKLKVNKKENWGYELIYLNNTTGVKITYEYQEAFIFIMLYRLVNGSFKENPINIYIDSILYGYELQDLVSIRAPQKTIKPAYEYGEESEFYDNKYGLVNYVSAFSQLLENYAKDILSGDFKIFHELEMIVKKRISLGK